MNFLFSGLAASCETLLLSELNVVSVKPIILNADNGLMHNNTVNEPILTVNSQSSRNNSNDNTTNNANITIANNNSTANNDKSNISNHQPITYKFFVPRDVDVVTIRFKVSKVCNECPSIAMYTQANALPTSKNFAHSLIIDANKTDEIITEFHPHQNAWHYTDIYFMNRDTNPTIAASLLSSSLPPTTKAFKSKSKFEKKFQFAANSNNNNNNQINNSSNHSNIFVNFSIGLQFINEMSSIEIKQKQVRASNTNKSTHNANMKTNKIENGNAGLKNEKNYNRTLNTENIDSSMSLDERSRHATTTTATTTAKMDDKFDELNGTDGIDETDNNNDGNDDDDFDTESETPKLSIRRRNINYYSLLRQTYREFFMFDYDLLPDENGTVPTFINLTAGIPTGFRFNIGGVYDIGGTLSFAVVMKDNLRDASIAAASNSIIKARNRMANDIAVAEKLVHINDDAELVDSTNNGDESTNKNNGGSSSSSAGSIDNMNYELNHSKENDDGIDNGAGRSNQTIIICMRLGEPGIPRWPDSW